MACAASLRVAARGGPTVHGSARSFEDTGAPFRRQHLFRPRSPSPRDGLDDLEAQAAFDCNHSSSAMASRRSTLASTSTPASEVGRPPSNARATGLLAVSDGKA